MHTYLIHLNSFSVFIYDVFINNCKIQIALLNIFATHNCEILAEKRENGFNN